MIPGESLRVLLRQGLADLRHEASEEQIDRLLHYAGLLRRWGRVYNLTAIDRPEDVIRYHLLDSLSIWPYLRGPRILDVGTGAGLPGMPLAVLLPQHRFELLDRTAKKVRFVTQAKIELGLKNVCPVQSRIEDFAPAQRFDAILVRAYGSLSDIWLQTRHLLSEEGLVLAMKGRAPEPAEVPAADARMRVIPLHVPGLEAERHLIELTASH